MAVAAGQTTAQGASPERPHFEGEHGLRVYEDGDRLRVEWITRTTSPGFLTVLSEGDTLRRKTTRNSIIHGVRFEPPDHGTVTLHYGARRDTTDRHRTTIRLPLRPDRPAGVISGIDSLYVVGDVHGQFGTLRTLLENAGLVDGAGRWSGGSRHLVMLGDLMDRGPDVTRTLWYLYGLEGQAAAAGGSVHVVLGNHEVMVMTGDVRYVSPKERMLSDLHGVSYPRLFDPRGSVLGQWLASRPAALQVDDVLLAHGGIGPDYADWSVPAINDTLAAYVREDLFLRWSDSTVEVAPMDSAAVQRRIDFFHGPGSVFWYRGYLRDAVYSASPPGDSGAVVGDSTGEGGTPDDTLDGAGGDPGGEATSRAPAEVLEHLLARHDASVHVVAHTPLDHVEERFGGRLIGVDLRRPAREMLLLVRRPDGEGWERFRVGLEGEVAPLVP